MLETGTRTRATSYSAMPPTETSPRFNAQDVGLKKRVLRTAATFGTTTGGAANAVAMAGLVAAGFQVGDLVTFSGTNANNGSWKVTTAPTAASGPYGTDHMLCDRGFKPESASAATVRTL